MYIYSSNNSPLLSLSRAFSIVTCIFGSEDGAVVVPAVDEEDVELAFLFTNSAPHVHPAGAFNREDDDEDIIVAESGREPLVNGIQEKSIFKFDDLEI